MTSFLRFVFGPTKWWEYKLIFVRMAAVALSLLAFYVLLQSPWKHLATPLFWLCFLVLVVSITYQLLRRWRESRTRVQPGTEARSNHDA
ncbi:hypothetical protein [Aquabacterium sp. J223]|uniref:hypothetical protein n=1 Tax=Aquabacterium sp. J223 TaxID=2898431 RepID=UPI0021ADE47E|nr:hypothetical protein [Aquabacterium sp. J223]UUX94945.1 hypothetical protein LRS07_17090 [Aquabacterium sp. J223]